MNAQLPVPATLPNPETPAPLRWSLLTIACELLDPRASDFLARTATMQLPAVTGDEAGRQRRSSELALRVLAVDALGAIARRHPRARVHLIRVIRATPEREVLYEAIRTAEELGLHDEIRSALPRLRDRTIEIEHSVGHA